MATDDSLLSTMLAEAREDLSRADQKASLLLAAVGVGFGAVLGGQFAGDWSPSALSDWGQIAWWVGVLAAIVSVACSALAVWPRFPRDGAPLYGITYWGHMAQFDDADALRTALADQTTDTITRVSHQLFNLSKVVLWKYRFVRYALVAAAAAGGLLGVAAIVLR
ncbi:Pycsar system effector family protein [Pseudolysinimonas sp.]|jgi:hypothetical protein|uniref:Pycsar system effector family protein n=1 Tax=Pseudolysinimonas sp. TaxID=2680009 RepID=UPI0037849301